MLTGKECIILSSVVIIVIGLIFAIIRKSIQFAMKLIIAFVCAFLLLFWLPDKLHEIQSGQTTVQDTIDDVTDGSETQEFAEAIHKGGQYVQDNYQGWADSAISLWHKIIPSE